MLSRWGVPILVGVAAIVVIVVLIIAFTNNSGGASGGGNPGTTGSNGGLPIVRVGSDGGGHQGDLPRLPGRSSLSAR